MTITRSTRVVGVAPRISRAAFIASLAKTPSAADAGAAYDALVALTVDPLYARAVFRHESTDGTKGICATYDTRSPGNTRSTTTGVGYLIYPPGRGQYVKYPSWLEGWRDLGNRLVDRSYVYAVRGLVTIEQIQPVFAPTSDGNDPNAYINAVVAFMNANADLPEPLDAPPPVASGPRPAVILAAGHHNTSGGHPDEIAHTGELTEAIARALLAAGAEVRVVTPDGPDEDLDPGDGMYPGTLSDVAAKALAWHRESPAHVFLENHSQGVSNTSVRGAFGIYPDWDDDLDVDARDRLIPLIIQKLVQYTELPRWGSGLMSERDTGVGLDGFRLGIFRVTAPAKANLTRLIVEYGAHTNPDDYRILQTDSFRQGAARAVTEAIFEWLGAKPSAVDGPAPSTAPVFHPETGRYLGGGFRLFWERNGGLARFGHPLTDEYPALGLAAVQYTERARFEWHGPEKDVMLGLLGREITAGREQETPFLPREAPKPGDDSLRYFPETQHGIGGGFRAFWEANGGLEVFGFPISEEFDEVSPDDGVVRTVQYFERARFEFHGPADVRLGRLGAELLDRA